MKARVADELARSDLTSQIAFSIEDAIAAYQDERFHFNEGRSITFPTSAGTEFYDSSANSSIATIQKIDYVMVLEGNQPFELLYMSPGDMESSSVSGTNTGQPGWYTWYGNQIRVYPTPAAVQIVRIGASIKVAAPASDSEANNPWMLADKGERLIRSRAKFELALHVLKDRDLAETMTAAVQEAEQQLIERTVQLTQAAKGRIRPMRF